MSTNYWYRLFFKVRLLEVDGFSFQRLVEQLFQAVDPRFQPVAPWGSAGDGGNDGFIPTSGRYLQVYGPGPTSSWSPVKAAQKAQQDFDKLKNEWADIRQYSFVLNDRFHGIPGPVHQALQNIQADHRITTDAVGAAHLTDLFVTLPDDRKQGIVGGTPPTSRRTTSPPH